MKFCCLVYSLFLLLSSYQNPISQSNFLAQNSVSFPTKNSSRWYYERALVLQVQEKPAHAIVELYRSIEQLKELSKKGTAASEIESQTIAINHLLGIIQKNNKRIVDAINCLEIVAKSPLENIPARLELAKAYVELKSWDKAFIQVQRLIPLTNARGENISKKLKQIKLWLPRINHPERGKNLETNFSVLLVALEDSLLSSPESYRELTLGKKIRDPLIYTQLTHLFTEEENLTETQSMLLEAIRIRDGFFPIGYIGLGEVEETIGSAAEQTSTAIALENYVEALKNYQIAVEQLKALDFSQEKEEIDLAHISELQKKIEKLRAQ